MIRRIFSPAILALVLVSGCAAPSDPQTDLERDTIARRDDTPPPTPQGACWTAEVRPAVLETVTEQILVPSDGGPAGAAVFRTVTQQRMLRDRQPIWLRIPCATDLPPDFIASLQRALKARGFFAQPLTGQLDAATRNAIRRYQGPLGLESDQLSLTAARSLGLIAQDFGRP